MSDTFFGQLQVADSKAKRFAGLVGSLKDKLIEENETKQGLCKEIVKLKEEVVKAKVRNALQGKLDL